MWLVGGWGQKTSGRCKKPAGFRGLGFRVWGLGFRVWARSRMAWFSSQAGSAAVLAVKRVWVLGLGRAALQRILKDVVAQPPLNHPEPMRTQRSKKEVPKNDPIVWDVPPCTNCP